MRESYFQGEWINSWRHHFPRCHIVKIPDMPKTAGSRFLPPKPYDFYAVLNGQTYMMELKLKTKLGGFPFSDVTEWQINNLMEARENRARAHVIINYRVSGITHQQQQKYSLTTKKFNKVFFIYIAKFVTIDNESTSRSIPFRTLLELNQIEKNGKYWDIPEMIKQIKEVTHVT